MTKPHKTRMANLGRFVVPPIGSSERQEFEMDRLDISRRPVFKVMAEMAYSRVLLQSENGAGLQMDQSLREFLIEYNSRAIEHGMDSMPSNFNVLEAFFDFIEYPAMFSLRPEIDHLFSMPSLIDYATAEAVSEKISELVIGMQDSIIYSYNVCSSLEDQLFSVSGGTDFAVGGISLVKHDRELSVMMLCGERSEFPKVTSEAKRINKLINAGKNLIFKRPFGPDPDLKPEAVPLLESKSFARRLVLARIDLDTNTFEARYLLLDLGNNYTVLTDDFACGLSVSTLTDIAQRLDKYEALFHALKVMLQLPCFFKQNDAMVRKEKRETELDGKWRTTQVVKARSYATSHDAVRARKVFVLDQVGDVADLALFVPPHVEINNKGRWKKLRHDQIGTDKNGRPVHGRTWVEERATWLNPDRWQMLAVSRRPKEMEAESISPAQGYIYIMRCAAHATDVFKVGLTTRKVEERASELSGSTSSPTPFLTVLSWEVTDCVAAEKEIHDLLVAFRVSNTREFFRAPLAILVKVSEPVIKKYGI